MVIMTVVPKIPATQCKIDSIIGIKSTIYPTTGNIGHSFRGNFVRLHKHFQLNQRD